MAVITELPPGAENTTEDHQIQPMGHQVQNGEDTGRDIGRVSIFSKKVYKNPNQFWVYLGNFGPTNRCRT